MPFQDGPAPQVHNQTLEVVVSTDGLVGQLVIVKYDGKTYPGKVNCDYRYSEILATFYLRSLVLCKGSQILFEITGVVQKLCKLNLCWRISAKIYLRLPEK